MWDLLKIRIIERNPTNLDDLWNYSVDEWHKIPQESFNKLFESLPDRVAAVIKCKGGNTKFGP